MHVIDAAQKCVFSSLIILSVWVTPGLLIVLLAYSGCICFQQYVLAALVMSSAANEASKQLAENT